jgi:hypothetical protein
MWYLLHMCYKIITYVGRDPYVVFVTYAAVTHVLCTNTILMVTSMCSMPAHIAAHLLIHFHGAIEKYLNKFYYFRCLLCAP